MELIIINEASVLPVRDVLNTSKIVELMERNCISNLHISRHYEKEGYDVDITYFEPGKKYRQTPKPENNEPTI